MLGDALLMMLILILWLLDIFVFLLWRNYYSSLLPAFNWIAFYYWISGLHNEYNFPDECFVNTLYHFVACLLIFLVIDFDKYKFLILIKCTNFLLQWLVLSVCSISTRLWRQLCFLWGFTFLAFIRFLIHLEFLYVLWYRHKDPLCF